MDLVENIPSTAKAAMILRGCGLAEAAPARSKNMFELRDYSFSCGFSNQYAPSNRYA
jgi:hypothetical protein